MSYEDKLRQMSIDEIEQEMADIQEEDEKLLKRSTTLKRRMNHLSLKGKDWQKKHNFYLKPVDPVTTLDAVREEYNTLVRKQGHLNYRLKMITIVLRDRNDEEI